MSLPSVFARLNILNLDSMKVTWRMLTQGSLLVCLLTYQRHIQAWDLTCEFLREFRIEIRPLSSQHPCTPCYRLV